MLDVIPCEVINWTILNEIISMDEDDPEFSRGLITQFIDQAENTFHDMDVHLHGDGDLKELDNLGHFLKGSSAALGLQRIAWVCERIQNLGRKLEQEFPSRETLLDSLPASAGVQPQDRVEPSVAPAVGAQEGNDDAVYLALIGRALAQARIEFKLARTELSQYYGAQL
ncbi:Ypd1p KNAG_0E02890 [Huiozyma naganishii CBS 8797]|uniref:Phosphorelay intermediate protein YPD1 n=1 Tax=Huiozyma naganishii (strain ATCC MYA-139 / BCRC 22969 / CBS 8797 / KCTC 17520 / NBRC 10181 / NCYC 3082 / Yp74L-3) TaxID=1071383 RepID=J7RLY2_HUIN7|nr:hypothetical protein KNAG_0E02890 [Kazachstania naganishii CBS 8797]CCK70548.1 hypothetical protein KNAG_0E02890 [Kazachstania naganishii CBS 8797]